MRSGDAGENEGDKMLRGETGRGRNLRRAKWMTVFEPESAIVLLCLE